MIDARELLATLEAHPDVFVYTGVILPGISESTLANIEKYLGINDQQQLASGVRRFYQKHNGVAIRWISKYHPRYNHEVQRGRCRYGISTANCSFLDRASDGDIVFPPLQDVLMKNAEIKLRGVDKKRKKIVDDCGFSMPAKRRIDCISGSNRNDDDEMFPFGGIAYPSMLNFLSRLRIFEYNSNPTISTTALLCEMGEVDPKVLFFPAPSPQPGDCTIATSSSKFFRSSSSTPCSTNNDTAAPTADAVPRSMPLSRYLMVTTIHFGICWRRDWWFTSPCIKDDFSQRGDLNQVLEQCRYLHIDRSSKILQQCKMLSSLLSISSTSATAPSRISTAPAALHQQ